MSRKHTGITVELIGTDGNIFALLAKVRNHMRKAKVPQAQIERFTDDVRESKSYDQALLTIMEYVDVD